MKLRFDTPLLMGILNLTPDSFLKVTDANFQMMSESDESTNHSNPEGEDYHSRLQELIDQGADIIDIGAESTFGPESQVYAEEEWGRLEPVLSQIDFSKTFVSVDTWKAEVAEKALELGVQMINDVTALRGDSKMIEVLLEHKPYICLMYSADETPYASRTNYQYQDVMSTISQFLRKQTQLLLDKSFPREKIIIDPGLGFFISSDPHFSWEIIDRLEELKELGFPILIGHSMKSFLGGPIEKRLPKTLGAAEMCLEHGAKILRVHHVAEHKKLLGED